MSSKKASSYFQACRRCKRLVPRDAKRCPYCGSTDLTKEWFGLVIILDKNSMLAEKLELDIGEYALKVR